MSSKKRATNLCDDDIREVAEILDGWVDKNLSWNRLIDAVAGRLFRVYTRQTLYKHERIRNAFELAKMRVNSSREPPPRKVSQEVQVLLDCKARLEAKVERLEVENNRLLEQYVLLTRNAYVKGLTIEDLTRPLPTVNRGQTEKLTPLKNRKDKKK